MKLKKTLDGYVVHVPDDVVASLALKEGDGVTLSARAALVEYDIDAERSEPPDCVRAIGVPFAAGYKFDREEVNAR